MVINRYILAAFLALATQHADAFTPPSRPSASVGRNIISMSAPAAAQDVTDVSIPYDAAARLAYDGWCTKFNKEPSDEKFATFKANYETITVANVVNAKESRDNGTERTKDLELNEYGDMTEAEYMAMQSGGADAAAPSPAPAVEEEQEAAAPEKGALETVMEASAAQSEASSALAEAADALAEEEEVRFFNKQLFHIRIT